MSKLKLFYILISFTLVFTSCTKNEPTPKKYFWKYGASTTFTGVITTIPNQNFAKPNLFGYEIPTTTGIANSVVYRDGFNNFANVGSVSGTTLNKVSSNLINSLTLGNSSLSGISGSTKVYGWLVKNVIALYPNGSVGDVTNQMPISSKEDSAVYQSLSVMISFYPDGYYTIINTFDQKLNHWGWYQLAMSDNIPVAVVYNQFGSGANFDKPPLNFGNSNNLPTQGFGIWGLQNDAFYPLFAIGKKPDIFQEYSNFVFLKTTPVQYQIQ